jgi:secondary thiamine-phosphate synthase enzyme
MAARLSTIASAEIQTVTSASLSVQTGGEGLTEITADAKRFVAQSGARDGVLLLYLRHTSASLIIQENADPDVGTDLMTSLRRLAPENAGWVHDTEGPDDMPAHVKTMLTGVSLHVPVIEGELALGTWQGIYLVEHRARPHRREVLLQFIGSRS